MDIKDLMKLIDAGFTKEEIMKLSNNSIYGESVQKNVQEETQTESKQEETKTESKQEETKTESKQEETKTSTESRLDEIISGLKKVTETMQKTAVQNSRQPEAPSMDDFLATIIDPTYKKE